MRDNEGVCFELDEVTAEQILEEFRALESEIDELRKAEQHCHDEH
jgi:hypothetical protein